MLRRSMKLFGDVESDDVIFGVNIDSIDNITEYVDTKLSKIFSGHLTKSASLGVNQISNDVDGTGVFTLVSDMELHLLVPEGQQGVAIAPVLDWCAKHGVPVTCNNQYRFL